MNLDLGLGCSRVLEDGLVEILIVENFEKGYEALVSYCVWHLTEHSSEYILEILEVYKY